MRIALLTFASWIAASFTPAAGQTTSTPAIPQGRPTAVSDKSTVEVSPSEKKAWIGQAMQDILEGPPEPDQAERQRR